MEAPAPTLPRGCTQSSGSAGEIVYKLDDEGSLLIYYPSFLPPADAASFLSTLLRDIPWQNQGENWQEQPRQVAWFSDDPTELLYSSVKLRSNTWIQPLLALRERVVAVPAMAAYHAKFPVNSCLANLYAGGNNFLGFHSDTPLMFGNTPTIGSLTLGSARRFVMVRKKAAKSAHAASNVTDPADRLDMDLPSGSLLLMAGNTQEHWLHGLPRQPEITEPRINLTFRHLIAGAKKEEKSA